METPGRRELQVHNQHKCPALASGRSGGCGVKGEDRPARAGGTSSVQCRGCRSRVGTSGACSVAAILGALVSDYHKLALSPALASREWVPELGMASEGRAEGPRSGFLGMLTGPCFVLVFLSL